MAGCETVEVQAAGGGSKWINASDFDGSKHKLFKAPVAKKKPAKMPAKKEE